MKKEVTTIIKGVKTSPRKLRVLLPSVRKVRPVLACDMLSYTTKRAAQILRKAILSAMANAEQTMKVKRDLLEWKTLAVDMGFVMKRFRAGGRGTAKPFKKRQSHITIVLSSEEIPQQRKDLEKPSEKKEVKRKVTKNPIKQTQSTVDKKLK